MIGRWTRVGGVLVLSLLAAGCTKGFGNVSGTVKYNGNPLPAGTITFYDQDNQTQPKCVQPGVRSVFDKIQHFSTQISCPSKEEALETTNRATNGM